MSIRKALKPLTLNRHQTAHTTAKHHTIMEATLAAALKSRRDIFRRSKLLTKSHHMAVGGGERVTHTAIIHT